MYLYQGHSQGHSPGHSCTEYVQVHTVFVLVCTWYVLDPDLHQRMTKAVDDGQPVGGCCRIEVLFHEEYIAVHTEYIPGTYLI